ncbi:ATPase, T2SS/T4P/T4SS family [Motilimonas cestriensis]|uniref:ATPase, T2SS/T4P/T4SS family n=1 Tax=Motilimonas cestriensis TaxID=2742685 RepID=UPI003DA2AD7E
MIYITVHTKKGTHIADIPCINDDCLIGKGQDCLVQLRGWGVSKHHCRVSKFEDKAFIKSVGKDTFKVNGEPHNSYGPLTESDTVAIGGYELTIFSKVSTNNTTQKQPEAVEKSAQSSTTSTTIAETKEPSLSTEIATASDYFVINDVELFNNLRSKIHTELFNQIDLRRVNIDDMGDEELRENTKQWIDEIVAKESDIPAGTNIELLKRQVLNEAIGLGPLEEILADEDVSEVMVNCYDEIFFEKAGVLQKSSITFSDNQAVISAIERIVAPIGRRIDESSPMVDARLKDGSRVNAVIPPLALKGPCITIRKFMKERLRAEDLVRFNSIDKRMSEFLKLIVLQKKNLVISGGTGSGKTTLLNVLSNYIPDGERIVTVEDAAELKLYQPNLVSLEARPPNQEGAGAIPIRQLVKNCLRMRPDRIVVGECRGGEALDMLQAMNTGHDGSLTTAHANTPRDCLSRIEVMVMMSGMDLPIQAIREQVSSAVHFIVQQTRFSCGTRKVTSIAEVSGIENGRIQLSEIFKFEQNGYCEKGKIKGKFVATGLIPDFCEEMNKRGMPVDLSLFREEEPHADFT